jgi:hypothetical protein
VATVITQPADMIKTRAQLQRTAAHTRTASLVMQICSVRAGLVRARVHVRCSRAPRPVATQICSLCRTECCVDAGMQHTRAMKGCARCNAHAY